MKRISIAHITARLLPGSPSLCNDAGAEWFWDHLRQVFPEALFALLMPTHLHLICPMREGGATLRSLARLLGHHTRKFNGRDGGWRPLEEPAAIRTPRILERSVRYVALNPCRDNEVPDPLMWEWSTYRDVMGAVVDPWITDKRLARMLRWRIKGFRDRFHAYVSKDPSVDLRGTPPPRPALDSTTTQFPIAELVVAASVASRKHPEAVRHRGVTRDVFLHLARLQGWKDRRLLEQVADISRATLLRIHARPLDPGILYAGRLCLGDPRLRAKPRIIQARE